MILGWAAQAGVEPTAFSQLSGTAGCLMQIGYDVDHGCGRVGGLDQARGVALSPGDGFVYVASGGTIAEGSNGIVTFRRDGGTGALRRIGCVTANGGDGLVGTEGACARGDSLLGAADVEISPDGRTAYVAAASSGGVAWLARDPETGALTPSGCLKDFPRADRCGEARLLTGAEALAVSADGSDVYVVSPATASLHLLTRDPASGALAPVQCLSETGSDGVCENAAGLQGVDDVAISPDARAVYTVGDAGAVSAFARDPATGRLSQTGCLLDRAPAVGPCEDAGGIDGAAGVAVSPDGRDVYVAADASDAVSSFHVGAGGRLRQTGCIQRAGAEDDDEDTVDKRCESGTAQWDPSEIVLSADGRTVFAGGADTITSYRRDPDTGKLVQLGCAEEEQSSESCLEVRATLGVNALAATVDGRNVYVTAEQENAVTVLGAAVTVVSSAVRADRAGRLRISVRCPASRVRRCAGTLRAGHGAARHYALRRGRRARFLLRVGRPERRILARDGRVHVKVLVRDRSGALRPTVRRVLVSSVSRGREAR
jgi:DNA-binding beta-propeller fold protein YncE